MKLNGCEYKRNCSVSQVLFDLFRAGVTFQVEEAVERKALFRFSIGVGSCARGLGVME